MNRVSTCLGLAVAIAVLAMVSGVGCASGPERTETTREMASDVAEVTEDVEFLWLEDILGDDALAWVNTQNERSVEYLQGLPLFESLHEQALAILTSDERLAYPNMMGEAVTNFWRDAKNERGLWRMTSQEEYRQEAPLWDVIIDLDALAEKEGQNWVWSRPTCRYPDYNRCIINLSIGGSDATVSREFDVPSRSFVEDGFQLDESKSFLMWRDDNSMFFGPAFAEDEVTTSGYPREVYIWDRGTDSDDAKLIFEAEKEDMLAYGMRVWDGDDHYDIVVRMPRFFAQDYYFYRDGELNRLDIPLDAKITTIMNGQVLVQLRSEWTRGDQIYPQGALIAADINKVLEGKGDFSLVFEPEPQQSVQAVSTTKNTVLITILDNVAGELIGFTYGDDGWQKKALEVPSLGTVSVLTTSDTSDVFYYRYTNYLTPTSIFESDAVENKHLVVRSEPAWFDSEGMDAKQYEATSKDGTKVPYFVVTPKDFVADGTSPTLLYGYGGFEVSMTPYYSGVMGTSWLSRGGVFVVANIRGGGEFGPAWHQAALKENRQRAFDDFIAVAEDLIARKITSPQHLGINGGSNGGLLVGAVMVQRPDLFNAVVCEVPLLDMLRYHKLLAGASWMVEYGNPEIEEEAEFLKVYSPFQNLRATAQYPKAFFTTSTRDDRVHPAHARRMVAKMLAQGHDVLYYENIEGGHGGASNQRQRAFIEALTYTYLHAQLRRNNSPIASD